MFVEDRIAMMRKPRFPSLLTIVLVLGALLLADPALAQRKKKPPKSQRPKKMQVQKRPEKVWDSSTQRWVFADDD